VDAFALGSLVMWDGMEEVKVKVEKEEQENKLKWD